MNQSRFYQTDILKVTIFLFQEAIEEVLAERAKPIVPLARVGSTVTLFGEEYPQRRNLITVRNYNDDAELLITDANGTFLFYGRFDASLGSEAISSEFWRIFSLFFERFFD